MAVQNLGPCPDAGLVQFALTAVFGAIGLVLLSRPHAGRDVEAPDVRAAATAVEAIALVALVWVAFQAVAAFALVRMWRAGRAGLGLFYTAAELVGIVLTAIVAWRLRTGLGRPKVPRGRRPRRHAGAGPAWLDRVTLISLTRSHDASPSLREGF